jgi:peptidoglycan hydrolase-like protein with peptidoglycan-binding domain
MAIEEYQRQQNLEVTGEITPELIDHIRFTLTVAKAAEFTGSVDAPPPATSDADERIIMKVQGALADLGYETGDLDGTLSEATRSAILKFEMDRGLAMDGEITDELLQELAGSALAPDGQ